MIAMNQASTSGGFSGRDVVANRPSNTIVFVSRSCYSVFMPRLPYDLDLHAQVQTLVAEHDGNVSAAAEALGVSYMLLWRFEKSGSALARNLAAIRAGLAGMERAEDAPKEATPRKKTKHKREKIALLSQSDVARLRGMLHHLVRALDAYEAEGSDPARSGSDRTPS